jgi:hypothetical protein
MKSKTNIDSVRAEIITLENTRDEFVLDSPKYKRAQSKIDKLRIKLGELRDIERKKPLFKTEGVSTFHVLTNNDLQAIWKATGVKKTLVRVTGMQTAKYSVKSKNGIIIYLDVRPCGIYYSTNKV